MSLIRLIQKSSFIGLRLLLICVGLSAQALAAPLYCTDLAQFACLDGLYDEGAGLGSFPFPGQSKDAFVADIILKKSRDYFKKEIDQLPRLLEYQRAQQPCHSSAEICRDPKRLLVENLATVSANQILPWAHFQTLFPKESESGVTRISNSLRSFYRAESETAIPNEVAKLKARIIGDFRESEYLSKLESYLRLAKPVLKRVSDSYWSTGVSQKLRDAIHRKIDGIHFSGNCRTSDFANDTSSIFINNLFYHPASNSFSACLGMGVLNSSVFAIIFDLAHEMSHSISPCGIDVEYDGLDIFDYPDGADLNALMSAYPLNKALRQLEARKVTKLRAGLPTEFGRMPMCNFGGSVMDEAVADFFAVEVLLEFVRAYENKISGTQFANGFANTFRFACGPDFTRVSGHPSSEERLNRILLPHPEVQRLMRCK